MAKTKTTTKKSQTKSKSKAGEKEVTVCRRRDDRRAGEEEADAKTTKKKKKDETVVAEVESETPETQLPERREKVQRRRQIDPTTCERDYTNDEIEFMHALDAYKRANGRMFPTCSEILEVVRGLGYEKIEYLVADGLIEVPESADGEASPEAEGEVPAVESADAAPSPVAPIDVDVFAEAGGFSEV